MEEWEKSSSDSTLIQRRQSLSPTEGSTSYGGWGDICRGGEGGGVKRGGGRCGDRKILIRIERRWAIGERQRNARDAPTCPSLLILTGLLSFQGFLRSWQLLKSRDPLTEQTATTDQFA